MQSGPKSRTSSNRNTNATVRDNVKRISRKCSQISENQDYVQGSVFGPLLFVMYTTPLSALISSCSLNHHLNEDDTQLFLSFLPTHLDSSIDHLHNALDRISSWITANLLTLNSPKTEFRLIGLSKQLPKINNSSLTTTHSARNLGFIFDEHLTFSDQISSVSKPCY